MNAEEIDLMLGLLKFGWENGVCRGEAGSVQLIALRMKLEEMKAHRTAPKPEIAK